MFKPIYIGIAAAVFVSVSVIMQTVYFSRSLENVVNLFELKLSLIRPQTPVTPLSCPACPAIPACPSGISEGVFREYVKGAAKDATDIRRQLQEIQEKLPQQKPGRRGELPKSDTPVSSLGAADVSRGSSGVKGVPSKSAEPPNSDTR